MRLLHFPEAIVNIKWSISAFSKNMLMSNVIKCNSGEYMYYIEKNIDGIGLYFTVFNESANIPPPRFSHDSVEAAKQCAEKHLLTYKDNKLG